jgi:hypothetical protein
MSRNTFVEDANKLFIRRQLFENVYIVSHYERSLGPVACPGKKTIVAILLVGCHLVGRPFGKVTASFVCLVTTIRLPEKISKNSEINVLPW